MAHQRKSIIETILLCASTGALVFGLLAVSATLFGLVLYYFNLREDWVSWSVFFTLFFLAGWLMARRKLFK
jgi:hypothetical protein